MVSRSIHDRAAYERMFERLAAEAFGRGEFGVLYELYADEYTQSDSDTVSLPLTGRERAKDYIRRLRAAFPDLSMSVEEVVVDDETVVVRYSLSGTFEAPWDVYTRDGDRLTIDPTGESFEVGGVVFNEFENGECVGTRHFTDELTMLISLKVLPSLADLVA
jgi:predicted ester cyclase